MPRSHATEAPAALEILAVRGLATVQDAGRPGFMHAGVPPGGALVPELALRANRGAGNDEGAPLIEVFGGLTLTPRETGARLCTEDGLARDVAPGEAFVLAASPSLRVRYLAVRGGLDVPLVLGGRGTLPVAHLGGHEGRALARGDRIAVGGARPCPEPQSSLAALDLTSAVRVIAGPDLARFDAGARGALTRGRFTILASSDRTGVRLEGRPVSADENGSTLRRAVADVGHSAPMVRGAIQVPPSGEPIVLGPDHPTTGGYPVIAVVARADLGASFARPIGASVRFRVVTLDEVRQAP